MSRWRIRSALLLRSVVALIATKVPALLFRNVVDIVLVLIRVVRLGGVNQLLVRTCAPTTLLNDLRRCQVLPVLRGMLVGESLLRAIGIPADVKASQKFRETVRGKAPPSLSVEPLRTLLGALRAGIAPICRPAGFTTNTRERSEPGRRIVVGRNRTAFVIAVVRIPCVIILAGVRHTKNSRAVRWRRC